MYIDECNTFILAANYNSILLLCLSCWLLGMELDCEVISELEENGSFYVRFLKNENLQRRIDFQTELK